jgi:predicted MFS family arabinose efflux permease
VKTWLTIAAVVVLNAALLFFALAPGVVTYAGLPPAGVVCSSCASPEVQVALTQAAAVGRAQIQSLVLSKVWWVGALALGNIAIVFAVLLRRRGENGNAV